MGEKKFKTSPPKNSEKRFFGPKMAKMTKNRKSFEKFFWSKSIQNGPKRILKRKNRV